jgi:PAS domain S-box-containing protein
MAVETGVQDTAVRGAEGLLDRAFDRMPVAMALVDADGRIALLNAQAEAVFGYARGELLGRPVETLVPERFRPRHRGYRTGFFSEADPRPMGAGRDLYGLRKDGSEFPVEIGLNPIETEQGPMVLSAIVDITERKQREERISAALREKELLLGEIHHRVKNNLQVVHSLLDLQALGIADPHVQQMVRDSQARVRSMALIHQTLYQSKDFARVNFQFFLDSLLPALIDSHAVDATRVRIEVNAHGVQLPINAAIPCGLIVNELVTNALKHAFPGDTAGGIRVELSDDGRGGIVLSVENDGAPIAADIDPQRGGTLGLRLVSLLTEQLLGRLEIRRTAPTRFLLHFPSGANPS